MNRTNLNELVDLYFEWLDASKNVCRCNCQENDAEKAKSRDARTRLENLAHELAQDNNWNLLDISRSFKDLAELTHRKYLEKFSSDLQ